MTVRRCLGLLSAALTISGCTATGQPESSSDEQNLEKAITGQAQRDVRSYFHRRLQFTIYTQCKPTTPDLGNWRCATTVASPRPYTQPCQIVTQVRSTGNNFIWAPPVPFARLTTEEQCGRLHSELPIN